MARELRSHAYRWRWLADEPQANAADPVLAVVTRERRSTLIAARHESAGRTELRFDINLQGDRETVFFNL